MNLTSRKWNKYMFRQFMVGIVVFMDSLLAGSVVNFSGTLLAQLDSEDSHIKITSTDARWIATIAILACIVASILNVGYLRLFGRKWGYFGIFLSHLFAWCFMALSTEVWHLHLTRAILGFNIGMAFPFSLIMVVETVEFKYRNIFLNFNNLGYSIGMLYADIMGSYSTWQTSAYILASFAAISLCVLLYLKNTHVPYLEKGDIEHAQEIYFWYRQESPKSWDEFNSHKTVETIKISFAQVWEECKRREFLLPLGITCWFLTTAQMTGGSGIRLYSVDVMRNVVSIDEYITIIITDVLTMIASFLTLIALEMAPSRLLINCTSVICAISLLFISLALYLIDTWSGWGYVSLIAIWIFNFFYAFGYMTISYICSAVLFTGISKATGIAIVGVYLNVLGFALGHLVPIMLEGLGFSGTFCLFGVVTIFGGIGLNYIMPEIRGISSEEIRLKFQRKSVLNLNK